MDTATGESPILKVKNLNKNFASFSLRDVSFELPTGYIMGFIGRNGAGKTTTLKSIMRSVIPDGGEVEIFGLNVRDNEQKIKQRVCFSTGTFESYPHSRADDVAKLYGGFFENWSFAAYEKHMKRFNVDGRKKIGELSAGMKVKFSIALSLSHDSKLFLFDEPTSGLDPVARDEMLDLFASVVEEGDKSILFSTHITSDLDKCADYIAFMVDGRLVLCDTKDNILAAHRLISGGREDLRTEDEQRAIGVKKTRLNYTALIKRKDLPYFKYDTDRSPNLEDIMIYYNRGGDIQ